MKLNKEKYLKNPGNCPYCGSEDIVGESIEIEGATSKQKVSCSDCYKEWNDIYTLSDVEEPSGAITL